MIQFENKNRLGRFFAASVLIHLFFAIIIGIYPTLQNKEIVNWSNKYVVDLLEYRSENTASEPDRSPADAPSGNIESDVEQTIPLQSPVETIQPAVDTGESDNIKEDNSSKKAESSSFTDKYETEKEDLQDKKKKLLTMKDLMPGYKKLLSSRGIVSQKNLQDEAVSLNTKDLKYLSYFSKIKEKIEMVWKYPEAARTAGLQGELTLVFLIKKDGTLAYVKVIKSSGIAILDKEAANSVKKAMPFFPLPKKLGNRLKVVANFRYSLSNFFIR